MLDIIRAQHVERIMICLRYLTIPFILWQVYTYYLPTPRESTIIALTALAIAAVGNTIIWRLHLTWHEPGQVLRLSWIAMIFDMLLVFSFIWAYTFDVNTAMFILVYILPLEAATRFGAKEAYIIMALAAVFYTIRELIGSQIYGYDFLFASITFRMGIGFVLTALAAALSTSWKRERERVHDLYQEEQAVVKKLEETDKLKNNFLSAVAHDMRTPLTVIMGYAMIMRNRASNLSEHEEMMIEKIVKESERLQAMIEDLLEVNRLSQGKVRIQVHEVDLKSVTKSVIDTIEETTNTPVVDHSDPLIIYLDQTHLERILENLLGNAVKYGDPNLERPIELHASVYREGILIQVDDHGPGVADKYKEEIFEAFKRGDADDSQPGTGVGLALVRQLAELYGGRAWVEDREGGGARFCVYLPERRAAEDLAIN